MSQDNPPPSTPQQASNNAKSQRTRFREWPVRSGLVTLLEFVAGMGGYSLLTLISWLTIGRYREQYSIVFVPLFVLLPPLLLMLALAAYLKAKTMLVSTIVASGIFLLIFGCGICSMMIPTNHINGSAEQNSNVRSRA